MGKKVSTKKNWRMKLLCSQCQIWQSLVFRQILLEGIFRLKKKQNSIAFSVTGKLLAKFTGAAMGDLFVVKFA